MIRINLLGVEQSKARRAIAFDIGKVFDIGRTVTVACSLVLVAAVLLVGW